MKKKKYIGQLLSIRFTDRKEVISGIVIDYNDDWMLMKNNRVDYVIDGFVIIRQKNIKEFVRDAEVKWHEKVIKLKGISSDETEIIPLHDLKTILEYLNANAGLFLIFTKSESACYVGRFNSLDSRELTIDSFDTKGKWDGQMSFRPGDIRVIEFDTDYLLSLKLVLSARNKK